MKHVFLLSQDFPDIAVEEIKALSGSSVRTFGHLAVCGSGFDFSRLALTRKVCSLLFTCRAGLLERRMESFDWSSVYSSSFSLTVHDSRNEKLRSQDLAKYVWRRVKNPKVSLKDPGTPIEVFITDSFAFVCLLTHALDQSFTSRQPKTLPAMHPTAIAPKIARAMVNLTGVPKGATFTDPFCGAGGLLIESASMGIKAQGYDIKQEMLDRARINLEHFNLKATLRLRDATTVRDLGYVAADLPYGRASSLSASLTDLYLSFLKNLKQNLKHRAVLIFPDFVDHKALIRKAGLKILFHSRIYVHRSLTRNLVVLTP